MISSVHTNPHYFAHLKAVLEHQPMVVTAPVIDLDGEALLEQGESLTIADLNRLESVRLQQPLVACIDFRSPLTANQLSQSLVDSFVSDPVLYEIFQQLSLDDLLYDGCKRACSHPLLSQYLRVMSLRLPKSYERALFCAWFAAILCQRREATREQLLDAFLAGLFHDLGMLLVPELASSDHENLSPEAWREMILHPELGCDMLEVFPAISDVVLRAVREHHEAIDGTGYPAQKVGRQLAPMGQIVKLLDSTHAVYTKYFKPRARTLHDLIPIIQMNQMSRPGMPAADLVVILRNGTASESCSVPEELMPDLIHDVKNRHLYIKQFVDLAEVFIDQHQTAIANARMFSFSALLEHIVMAMKQSGLINDAYMRWLDLVQQEQLAHAYREVEDVFLMMQEVMFHIQRFLLRLEDFVQQKNVPATQLTAIWSPARHIKLIPEKEEPADPRESARVALENFRRHPVPELSSALSDLWHTRVGERR